MRIKFTTMAMIVAGVLTLAACGQKSEPPAPAATPAPATAAPAAPAETPAAADATKPADAAPKSDSKDASQDGGHPLK